MPPGISASGEDEIGPVDEDDHHGKDAKGPSEASRSLESQRLPPREKQSIPDPPGDDDEPRSKHQRIHRHGSPKIERREPTQDACAPTRGTRQPRHKLETAQGDRKPIRMQERNDRDSHASDNRKDQAHGSGALAGHEAKAEGREDRALSDRGSQSENAALADGLKDTEAPRS
jgi:hypothetical protein